MGPVRVALRARPSLHNPKRGKEGRPRRATHTGLTPLAYLQNENQIMKGLCEDKALSPAHS